MTTTTTQSERGSVAPPREHFELGQKITFHHRCGVARYLYIDKKRQHLGSEWVVVEGCYSQEYAPWRARSDEDGSRLLGIGFTDLGIGFTDEDLFYSPMLRWAFKHVPKRKNVNKTIMVWPDDGEGIVIGLIRREIGESVRGYTDSYSGEYEPGYFGTISRHWLYVVKQWLAGTDTILVPMWAAQEKGEDV